MNVTRQKINKNSKKKVIIERQETIIDCRHCHQIIEFAVQTIDD